MLSAETPTPYAVKSFDIHIYDRDLNELIRYKLPLSIAAPFANRLFSEVLNLPDWKTAVREPWYSLAHHYEVNFLRSARPVGPTSLYGERYDPTQEAEPRVQFHPGAYVRSFVVCLLDFEKELYQGEYSVDDIFLSAANHLLRRGLENGMIPPQAGPYYYAVRPSARALYSVTDDVLPDDAYRVEGVFRLPPRTKLEPSIQFRRVKEAPLPECDPAHFGLTQTPGKGGPQAGRIFIPQRLYDALRRDMPVSDRNEEGGYALGNVYRLPGSPEDEKDPAFRWMIEITDLVMAEGTIGTPIWLLFTGDTWSAISRRRDRDFAGRKLVGWFHTHVFPASDQFGLSGMDQEMHAWYLTKPWQVAILLNLEKDPERTVRCYQRGPDGDLVETPFEIFENGGSDEPILPQS